LFSFLYRVYIFSRIEPYDTRQRPSVGWARSVAVGPVQQKKKKQKIPRYKQG